VVRRNAELPPILVTTRGEIHIGPVVSGGTSVLQRRREIAELEAACPGLDLTLHNAVESVCAAELSSVESMDALKAAQEAVSSARGVLGEAQLVHQAARLVDARSMRSTNVSKSATRRSSRSMMASRKTWSLWQHPARVSGALWHTL